MAVEPINNSNDQRELYLRQRPRTNRLSETFHLQLLILCSSYVRKSLAIIPFVTEDNNNNIFPQETINNLKYFKEKYKEDNKPTWVH